MEILRLGKRNKDRGWLQVQEAEIANRATPNPKSHLLTPEKLLVVQFRSVITSIAEVDRPNGSKPNADLAFALGVSSRTIREIDKRVLQRCMRASRKKRSDVGVTVFNSKKK